MTFVHRKNYKKYCILLKSTFEIPLFHIKEAREQTAAFNYYKCGYFPHDQQSRPSKKRYPVVTFVASSRFMFQLIVFKICAKNFSNNC